MIDHEATHYLYSLVDYPEELLFRLPRQVSRIEDVAQIAHLTANLIGSGIRVFYFNGENHRMAHIGTYTPDFPESDPIT